MCVLHMCVMSAQEAAAQAEDAVAIKYKYNDVVTQNVHWALRDTFSIYRNIAVAYVVHDMQNNMKVGVVTRPGRLCERLREITNAKFNGKIKIQALFFSPHLLSKAMRRTSTVLKTP